jgi:hypothetical protein
MELLNKETPMELLNTETPMDLLRSSRQRRLAVTLIVCLVGVTIYNIYARQSSGGIVNARFENGISRTKRSHVNVNVNTTTTLPIWNGTSDNNLQFLPQSNTTTAQSTIQSTLPTCLVYLHVPKVGGRTIGSFLNQIKEHPQLRHTATYSVYGERLRWDPRVLDGKKRFMLLGHFSTKLFDLHHSLRDCFVMTVLRQPVDRAISAFFFHGHSSEEITKCLSNSSITRRHCQLYWQYSNDMTRYFTGLDDMPWNTYLVGKNKNKAVPQPTNFSLDEAKRKLTDYFDLVCFLNDLPSCAERLLSAFQLGTANETDIDVSMMAKNNMSQYRTQSRPNALRKESMLRFQNANRVDKQLYDWAISNFHSASEKEGHD